MEGLSGRPFRLAALLLPRKISRMSAQQAGSGGRRRILALDGGGVRGVFTIEILARMQELLRRHYDNPELRLCDHFQFIAGTSAGAIIASLLAWGHDIEFVRRSYAESCADIFPPFALWRFWKMGHFLRALYESDNLSRRLMELFHDEDTGETALLNSRRLRGTLLICMRNSSTGSAWPVTNNPRAVFNQHHLPGSNFRLPLWQLLRASSAAPVYFLPQKIAMGSESFDFVDGGVTPYNNPALIAALVATLPSYRLEWPGGPDKLLVVSVGSGRVRSVLKDSSLLRSNIGTHLLHVPAGLMESISLQQDFLCRVMGQCLFGDAIDAEVGDLIEPAPESTAAGKKFAYVRYDHRFSRDELAEAAGLGPMNLSNTRMMPFLAKVGAAYAEKNVRLEHLL
jgi:hypothetical protein